MWTCGRGNPSTLKARLELSAGRGFWGNNGIFRETIPPVEISSKTRIMQHADTDRRVRMFTKNRILTDPRITRPVIRVFTKRRILTDPRITSPLICGFTKRRILTDPRITSPM